MKTLLMTPIIAAFIMILICCLAAPAHADDFITFDNPPMTRVERMVKLQVEKHSKGFDLAIREEIKPIDGRELAVDISTSRTSLPDEYMALPTPKSKMEHYAGR